MGLVAFVMAPAVLTLALAVGTIGVSEGAGAVFGRLFHPKGRSILPDYSGAEARRQKGDYAGTLEALKEEVGRHPGDPEPCLRIARLLRDELARSKDSEAWFRAAREADSITSAGAAAVSRELVELLRHRGDTAGALTELARLADVQKGTAIGDWADEERAHLKRIWLEDTP
jgi:hypothetical protein